MGGISDLEPQLANCRDYWLGWGAEDRSDGDLTYYRSGMADAQFNGVLRLRGRTELGPALVQAGRAFAGVPWAWWVGPDSDAGVAEGLLAHGAERVGAMPIMAVGIDRAARVESPRDLKIETAEGAATGTPDEWAHTYAPSFGLSPELAREAVRLESGRTDSGRIVRVTGRIDGRAVGTALMYDAHGVAGIYVVSTAASHRRQGIGAAVAAAALRAGEERGLRIGTLQAGGLGASVYRRMGFEIVAEYQLFKLPAP